MFASGKTASASSGASSANYIEDVFSTYLYTGNGSSQTITNGIDLSTKGGLVWVKNRTHAGTWHDLQDTERGPKYSIFSNTTNAAVFQDVYGVQSFNSDGFSVGSGADFNESTYPIASWTFRKQPKFFDVVTWTGDGTGNINIPHNLGSVPGCIMLKKTSAALDWYVYHRDLNYPNAGSPQNNTLKLNTTDAGLNSTAWQSGPTSTYFPVLGSAFNASGATYVAYLFAHNAGGFGLTGTDNVISCGSYTGNGSTTGPVINLGYEPQWVMIKRADVGGAGYNWCMYDTMRGLSLTGVQKLKANLTDAEAADTDMAPNATGFQLTTASAFQNASGGTYIYIAIRRGPMKVPTSGTSVFAPALGQSGNPSYITGFPVDFAMSDYRVNGANWTSSRLQGTNGMNTTNTDAEASDGSTAWDWMNGHYINGRTSSFISWAFRRAPSFFDEVCYTGTGSARTVTHNLGVAPEMMIVKSRSSGAESWYVYHSALGATNWIWLNDNGAFATTSTVWNNTAPTSSVFTVGTSTGVNASSGTYVWYGFATCAGVSKVGSYTGTGTTKQIDCGFTGGARFVLIKRTDSTGGWYVWDSARGIVAGNDPYLLLNSTAAEVTNTDYVDTYSAGFEISSTAPAAINASGGTFIFLAIA